MVSISRRRFLSIAAAGATLAATGGLFGCSSSQGSSSSSSSVSAEVGSWDEILEKAKGQTVSFLAWGAGGADAYVQKYWEQLRDYVKDEYEITLELTEFTQAEYQKLLTDIENDSTPTYDMFWYIGSSLAALRSAGGVYEDEWVKDLANYDLLDQSNPYITFDGTQGTDDLESPFQGCNPSLVYSTDLWSHSLNWDETSDGVNGLFHNFTELAEWVKKYPGKFTYMDLTGAGSFHGILFAKAILSELTDDGNGGWKTVYDESDDAATRRKKIQANIDDWYEWSNSSDASEEAFYDKASYLWAYLNELKPNLLQGDTGALYIATAPEMMQYVKAGDLACTFTTCTSVASRVDASPDSYMDDPAIYMLQTSVGYWDYNVIMKNSEVKEGAMVVCNAMLEPEQQMIAFETTGNGYNIDLSKLDSADKAAFEDLIADMGTLSPTSTEITEQSYADKYGKVAAWIASGWDAKVNRA
jgi:ABC-type uncharacterized transport system YnjBCD substrate-binding protein